MFWEGHDGIVFSKIAHLSDTRYLVVFGAFAGDHGMVGFVAEGNVGCLIIVVVGFFEMGFVALWNAGIVLAEKVESHRIAEDDGAI